MRRCGPALSHSRIRRGAAAIEILMTAVLIIIASITMLYLGKAATGGLHDFVSTMAGSALI